MPIAGIGPSCLEINVVQQLRGKIKNVTARSGQGKLCVVK